MKTQILQTSLIALLTIISLNIQAVSSETFKNNSIGEINAIESELNDDIALENWMTEVSAFNTCSDVLIEMETGIETWMTTVFTASSLEDKEVSMESWMTNLKEFNNHATAEEFIENDIQIEEWMTNIFSDSTEDINFVEQELVIEDWMTNVCGFSSDFQFNYADSSK